MNRRRLLAGATGLALLRSGAAAASRIRPSDQGWPSAAAWDQLERAVDGHLIKLEEPIVTQETLRNPYFIGDQAGMMQTSRRDTIRTGCSSCTTAWAAKTGATTVSLALVGTEPR